MTKRPAVRPVTFARDQKATPGGQNSSSRRKYNMPRKSVSNLESRVLLIGFVRGPKYRLLHIP
jgi:hypothetical protein